MEDRVIRSNRISNALDEAKRLELIVAAVRYCQCVKALGMPVNCYTKALREPVHFLWERRKGNGKERIAEFRSKNALGLRMGRDGLIYDHAIPFRILQAELLKLTDINAKTVREILTQYGVIVLLTKEEDGCLSKAGYSSRMPEHWDGVDPLARYKAVGIEIVKNK